MSSRSRVRRPTDAGSGGKVLRCRRSPPSASPYRRPDGRSGRATWISGIISGAGKLISSVFKSESPSPSTSHSYSTDDDSYDEDMDVSSEKPDELRLIERKLEPVKDWNGASLAIISEIESKHAIEQLIMHETFTRDEGKKLIKIIESRVVEVRKDGMQKELFDRTTCNAAVVQGRKWLEDKRLASSSKVNSDSKPCNLSTNMLQYDLIGEEDSPVVVAKSYMQSLSPWITPSRSSIKLEKSPCTGMHFIKDEAPSTTPEFSVPSSKGTKRNNPALGSQDKVGEIRRVRLKSTDEAYYSKCKPNDSSERYSGDDACKISSVNDEHIRLHSNKLSAYAILDTEEVNATRSTHEMSSCATLPSVLNSSVGTDSLFYDPSVRISDENQVVEQLDQSSGPCVSVIPALTSVVHAGNHVDTLLSSEAQTLPLVEFNSTWSDAEAVTRLDDFTTSSIQLSCRVENSSLDQKPVSIVKEMHSVAESAQHDGIGQTADEPNGSRVSADGSLAELNTNVAVALTADPDATDFKVILGLPSTNATTVYAPKTENGIGAKSRPRGGSITKSIRDVSKKPQSSMGRGRGRGRGRKSVPGARGGRGK